MNTLVLKSGMSLHEIPWNDAPPSMLQTESGEIFQYIQRVGTIHFYESLSKPAVTVSTTGTNAFENGGLPNVTMSEYVPPPQIKKIWREKKEDRKRPIEL